MAVAGRLAISDSRWGDGCGLARNRDCCGQYLDLHKSFGENEVLKGVDLTVRRGEVVTIIGPSGSGKSTLLSCINFLEPFEHGEITVDGEPVGWLPGSPVSGCPNAS